MDLSQNLQMWAVEFLKAQFWIRFSLLFINDLPDSVNSSCHLFADDCLLYQRIHTPHDADVLQQDLLSLER